MLVIRLPKKFRFPIVLYVHELPLSVPLKALSKQRMSDDDDKIERRFTILYGSQTGNAQDVAERISRQARRRRIKTSVFSMDEYDIVSNIESKASKV